MNSSGRRLFSTGRGLGLLLAALLPATLHATELPPGEYITAGGWGTLTVTRGADGGSRFGIESIGGNAHTCSLDGEVLNGVAALKLDGDEKPCLVRFRPKGSAIEVSSENGEACRYYCGMRASFEGLYLKPAPGCASAQVAGSRAAFKRLYDRRAYAAALAKLQPLLAACAPTLDWLELGWIRNDLALTQYKLGHLAACRETLAPLARDAARSEEELRQAFPPTDAENYLPVTRAARTNLKLCRGRGG